MALANSALELNDLATAEAAAHAAMGQATTQNTRLHARLIAARIAMARGDVETALPMLDELSRVRDEEVAVRASLHSLRLRRRTATGPVLTDPALTVPAPAADPARYRRQRPR